MYPLTGGVVLEMGDWHKRYINTYPIWTDRKVRHPVTEGVALEMGLGRLTLKALSLYVGDQLLSLEFSEIDLFLLHLSSTLSPHNSVSYQNITHSIQNFTSWIESKLWIVLVD